MVGPIPFSPSPANRVPMVPNLVSSPPSVSQVNLGLENPNLNCSSEIVECSVLSRIIGRVPCDASRMPLSQLDSIGVAPDSHTKPLK
jgi:hypothetical protein